MPRVAFHVHIRDGKREAYREAHQDVPRALEAAYLEAGAEIDAYSLFERDGHVFGYLDLRDPDALQAGLDGNDAVAAWSQRMESLLADHDEAIELDEVYRLI